MAVLAGRITWYPEPVEYWEEVKVALEKICWVPEGSGGETERTERFTVELKPLKGVTRIVIWLEVAGEAPITVAEMLPELVREKSEGLAQIPETQLSVTH